MPRNGVRMAHQRPRMDLSSPKRDVGRRIDINASPKKTERNEGAAWCSKAHLNRNEPRMSGAATCPTYLLPLAKREWRRIMAEFGDLGLVASVDQSALAAYCQAFALWPQASDEVQKTGITVREPIVSRYTGEVTGHRVKKNPALTILQQERAAMLAAGRLFGFDPSSRSSISAPVGQHPSSVESDNLSDYSFDAREDDASESVQ